MPTQSDNELILPINRILDLLKMKTFADNIIEFASYDWLVGCIGV